MVVVRAGDGQQALDLDAVLPDVDAVMMLRVQGERMNAAFFPSEREYSRRYGLDARRLRLLPDHAIVADLPCFHFGSREQDAVVASRAIAALVQARGLPFAPLHRVTEKRRGRSSWPEFTWDQFHPSALGYRVWESAFAGPVAKRARALG